MFNNKLANILSFLLLCSASALLLSCASDNSIQEKAKGWSVAKVYSEANSALNSKSYAKAITLYQYLEATYPYGSYAQSGLLELAYAYYKNDKTDEALSTLNDFSNLYSTSANMDYALYLKGYINYEAHTSIFSGLTRQDLAERDPKTLQEAYFAFYELATNYPNSRYAVDAKRKVSMLVGAMARGELYKARYYMHINAYLAAINRAQNVILLYSSTKYVEEALAIQISAYGALGNNSLATQVKQVLSLNFPRSRYLKAKWSYQDMAWYSIWHNEE